MNPITSSNKNSESRIQNPKLKNRARARGSRRGYTLLFAVLTATLVLGVAVFITSISRKQFILSETARESTFSLYAADSGLECALAANATMASTTGGNVWCRGTEVSVGPFTSSGLISGLTSELSSSVATFGVGNGGCTLITFTTGYDSSHNLNTVIDSYGYDTCTSSGSPAVFAPAVGSRTIERALELTYD